MLQYHRIVNSYQHSCTYILYQEQTEHVWLVDCGDYHEVKAWLIEHQKEIAGVFLTHGHDDHIYGLRPLIEEFPETPIYLSANGGIRCLHDIRLNLTKYTERSFVIDSDHFVELNDREKVELFDGVDMTCYQTDGHTDESMVYKVENYLLTGDAYIPPLQVVTKLPGANKERAAESLERIKSIIEECHLTVLAGHSI